MALKSLPQTSLPDISVIGERQMMPSKTYAYNIETGEFGRAIDKEATIEQAFIKAINTKRFVHVIYNNDYGNESDSVMGRGFSEEFIKSELLRLVRESFVYDDRVIDITNFKLDRHYDEAYVSCTIETRIGTVPMSGVKVNYAN